MLIYLFLAEVINLVVIKHNNIVSALTNFGSGDDKLYAYEQLKLVVCQLSNATRSSRRR